MDSCCLSNKLAFTQIGFYVDTTSEYISTVISTAQFGREKKKAKDKYTYIHIVLQLQPNSQ